MKKILTLILMLCSFALVSCNSGQADDSKRIDVPSSELVESLKLESVKNGKSIKEVDKTQKEYYEIKIAEDTPSTLFVYNSMLDGMLEEHGSSLQSINVNPLTFTAEITTTEAAKIMSEVFDASTGITKEALGLDFDLTASTSWTKALDAKDVVSAYNDGKRNNSLSIIYLPTYVEHVQNSKSVLTVYVFIPVYYEFTTYSDGKVESSRFDNLPIPALTFNENNLLPSNN